MLGVIRCKWIKEGYEKFKFLYLKDQNKKSVSFNIKKNYSDITG